MRFELVLIPLLPVLDLALVLFVFFDLKLELLFDGLGFRVMKIHPAPAA